MKSCFGYLLVCIVSFLQINLGAMDKVESIMAAIRNCDHTVIRETDKDLLKKKMSQFAHASFKAQCALSIFTIFAEKLDGSANVAFAFNQTTENKNTNFLAESAVHNREVYVWLMQQAEEHSTH